MPAASEGNRGTPAGNGATGPSAERTGKQEHRLLKAISAIFLAAVTAIIVDYAVQGTHSIAGPAVCEAKYLMRPAVTRPPSSSWAAYGVTQFNIISDGSFSIEPAPDLYTDEWFGATLRSPGTCDYRIDFDAEVTGPLHQQAAAALGYGYAFGARDSVTNGVPQGDTVQFDVPFGGLRTVTLPSQANEPGHNARPFGFVDTGRFHHWSVTVTGAHMLVSVDGQSYYPVDLSEPGTDLILRVWDAQLYIKNVEISKLRP